VRLARAVGLAMVLGASVVPAHAAPGPPEGASWLERRLVAAFHDATGGTLTLGGIDVTWTALTATITDARIEIPASDGGPPLTAAIGRAQVELAWSGLAGIGGGEIHLVRVVASNASFNCTREWIEAWRPRNVGRESAPVSLRVDRLEVTDGTAEYRDLGQKLVLRAAHVRYAADWSLARRLLVGEAAGDVAIEAPFLARELPASVRGAVRIGAGRIEIASASAEAPGARGEVSGTVTWGAGTSFTAEGRVSAELSALDPYLAGTLGLAGTASGPFQVIYTGGAPVRVVTSASTTGFRVGPIVTESASGELTLRPGRLTVERIDAQAYGGRFTGSVGIDFGPRLALDTDLVATGADVRRLSALTGRSLPLASTADLTLAIAGDPAHPASWTGAGTIDAKPRASPGAGQVVVRGKARLTFEKGTVRLVSDRLEMGEGAFRLDLSAGLAVRPPPIRLAIEGTTRDAAATQAAALAFLDALDVPRNRFVVTPLTGRGTLRASVIAGAAVSLDFGADLADGSWMGETFDRTEVDLSVDAHAATVRSVSVRRGGGELSGSLRYDLDAGALDRVDLHARDAPLGAILAAHGVDAGLDGRLDLDLAGDRALGLFAAQGAVSGRGVTLARETLEEFDSPVRIEGSTVILERISARGEALRFDGRALYDLNEGRGSILADPVVVDLARSRSLVEAGVSAAGQIEARGSVAISAEGPSGDLTLAASGVSIDTGQPGLQSVALGDLTGSVLLSGTGASLSVRALPESAWTLDAFLGWKSTLPLSAVLYFDDLRAGSAPAWGDTVDVRLKGQIQVEGELTRPRELEIDGSLDDVRLRVGSRSVQSTSPVPLGLESGRFSVGPSAFAGEGSRFDLRAAGSLDGAVEGKLGGQIDLGAVAALWPDLRGKGTLAVDLALSGTTSDPQIHGEIAVHDGWLRLIGFPPTLEQIEAAATVSGQVITLQSFRAFQGGGEITGTGRIDLTGLRVGAFHAEVTAANVSASYPTGFKGIYEGRLTVDGTTREAAISGQIRVVRALYARSFDTALSGATRRDYGADNESAIPKGISLDVDITAPGNVWVRNAVAKLEASGELHVGGQLNRPELTGRIAITPGGTVRYRDVDYTLDSGTLDLTDRTRINPYVDLRGRTRVGDYEIALRVEGTLDHFDYELTSTPPLASQDIISLLVTGKTLESLTTTGTTTLPTDMAAYYFTGLISTTFGPKLQQSLGIDQLEVTPTLLKGQTDPTARVTVGKRVSQDVKLVFSQDIGSTTNQTYQVVWDATRRIRIVAESDTESGLGGEIQYAKQFGGSKVGALSAPAAAASGTEEAPGRITSLAVRTETDEDRPDLLKPAKLVVGSQFSRGAALAAAERIRSATVKQGFLEASVRPDAVRDETAGTYALTFRATLGPRVEVRIEMASGGSARKARKTLSEYWRETPYTVDTWNDSAAALLRQLQDDGYYAADVTWEARDTGPGRLVTFHVDRGRPVRLKALRLHGVTALEMSRVMKEISSLQTSRLKRRLFRPGTLDADLGAVRALYRDEGYVRVRVAPPRIAVSAGGDAVEVDVDIDEGTRFLVSHLIFPKDLPEAAGNLADRIPLKVGGIFSPRLIEESEQALRESFDRLGYPEASVEASVVLTGSEAEVSFAIVPGGAKRVGSIEIQGNRITKRRTIAERLTFGVGDLLSREQILKTQQRLYRTGLFSGVKTTYQSLGGDDPTAQKVTVHVEEAPPLSLSVGVGYDNQDGPRASFLLGYSNLGGRAVGVALQGLVSHNEQRGQITFRRKLEFWKLTDALVSALWEDSVETGFTQNRRTFSFRFERRRQRWLSYYRYSIQQVRIGDITDPTAALDQIFQDKLSSIRLGSAGVGFVHDSRDDAFSPTRGFYGSLEGNIFAEGLGSEASFLKAFLRSSYTKTFRRGSRFSSFLRVGAEQPFAQTDLAPLSERFFAGGPYTLRGFAEDSVGGLILVVPGATPAEPPLTFNAGGEAILLLNEEWTAPIWKALRLETFLDVGNVYPKASDFSVTDVRASSGLGLRLETPIGPIRVEYGWKLDRREGESAGEWVIAIGALF